MHMNKNKVSRLLYRGYSLLSTCENCAQEMMLWGACSIAICFIDFRNQRIWISRKNKKKFQHAMYLYLYICAMSPPTSGPY